MNAAAIVYTSQTGFTARYAALLAERTGLPCRPLKEAAALPRGTAVIYLGWLCAGGIKGLKGARRRFRTAAVCAVGMAAEVEEAKLRRDNRLEGVPLFYLRGGYAPEKLTGFYRAMMAPMARLVSRAPAETEADRAMRDAFRDGGDWVSPERLAPVLLAEAGKSKDICANVDLYSGCVYTALGIPRDLLTPIFACARMAGWSAHRFEEIVSSKRIMRPAYKKTGHARDYVPMEQRQSGN